MAQWNQFRRGGAGESNPPRGGDTSVKVVSVNPTTSRFPGGATATLSGFNFRKNADGSAPSVLIDDIPATNVTLVDGNTLTFTIPVGVTVGSFDITVTIDGNVGTLLKGFTYFNETILSIEPVFGPIAGGTNIKILGVNFDPAVTYRVRFGDQFATAVEILDTETIVCVTPSHAVGFTNVDLMAPTIMFSRTIFSLTIFDVATQADNIYTTLPNGYQFTLLVRGEDIRRNPGINITEQLGAPPSKATFVVDGNSNAPVGGEKIQITDEIEDPPRVLWGGTVQVVKQVYEGQIDQLAWHADCSDFTALANKIRPKGAWFQVSASQVVTELIAQCCPGFTVNHVQTNLAKVTVVLDGSKDLITALNEIAAAIGGGHWYFDFSQDCHFFHIVPANIVTGVPGLPPTGGSLPGSFITLATGAPNGALVSYPRGYYALRSQNVYSDGTVSGLSPWSNIVQFDTSLQFSITNIPVGPSSATRTTTKRRLWYHRLSAVSGDAIGIVRPFCEIGDNTTTSFTCAFGSIGASVAGITDISQGSDIPTVAPSVVLGPLWNQSPIPSSHSPYNFYPFTFRYTFILADGTESIASPPTTFNQADSLSGWTCTIATGGINVVKRKLYLTIGGVSRWLEISDNTTTVITNSSNGTAQGGPYALYTSVSWLLTAFSLGITGQADPPLIANPPNGANGNHPPAPALAPSAAVTSYLNGDPLAWLSSYYSFRYAYLYRDGSVSFASPSSAPIGSEYMVRGYWTISSRIGVTPGPTIGTNNDCIARLIYSCGGLPVIQGYSEPSRPDPPGFPVGYGQGIEGFRLNKPDWSNMVSRGFAIIPDNTTDHIEYVQRYLGDDAFPTTDNVQYWINVSGGDFPTYLGSGVIVADGNINPILTGADTDFEFTPDPVPSWPNDDGPYLEDADPPGIIDDNNVDLLYGGDSGSQGFETTTDRTQVRNRIFVIGAGSTLTTAYIDGSLQIYVSDITSFALGGGKLRIEDVQNGNTEFATYSTLQQKNGVPFIALTKALSYKYSQNSIVYNYYQADDVESQKFMAKTELDAFGNRTDGVHEYTVTDSSLKTVWQLYMRAQAELELYSRPIVTIAYASRDPRTRIGRTVVVDLTNPPCKGSFLIQSVTIDQIRDEGDLLAPRYTAQASSIRYDLNDLLLKILGQQGGSGVSVGGISAAGASSANNSASNSGSWPLTRAQYAHIVHSGAPGSPSWVGVGTMNGSGSGGTLTDDNTEIPSYADNWRGDQRQSGWATQSSGAGASNQRADAMSSQFVNFLEDQVDVWFEFKTPVTLSGCLFHIGGFNFIPSGAFGTNIAFISLSYVQGTDSGWTVRMQTPTNGGNRTLALPTGFQITPSTFYKLRIQSTWDGSNYKTVSVTFTLNGSAFTVTQAGSYVVVGGVSQSAMPTSGAMVSNGFSTLGWGFVVTNPGGTSPSKKMNVRRIYMTSSGA